VGNSAVARPAVGSWQAAWPLRLLTSWWVGHGTRRPHVCVPPKKPSHHLSYH